MSGLNPWDDSLSGNDYPYDFFDENGSFGNSTKYFQPEQSNIFDIRPGTPSLELLQSGAQSNDDEGLDSGARLMYSERDIGSASRTESIGSIHENLGGTSSSYGDKLYQDYMRTTRREITTQNNGQEEPAYLRMRRAGRYQTGNNSNAQPAASSGVAAHAQAANAAGATGVRVSRNRTRGDAAAMAEGLQAIQLQQAQQMQQIQQLQRLQQQQQAKPGQSSAPMGVSRQPGLPHPAHAGVVGHEISGEHVWVEGAGGVNMPRHPQVMGGQDAVLEELQHAQGAGRSPFVFSSLTTTAPIVNSFFNPLEIPVNTQGSVDPGASGVERRGSGIAASQRLQMQVAAGIAKAVIVPRTDIGAGASVRDGTEHVGGSSSGAVGSQDSNTVVSSSSTAAAKAKQGEDDTALIDDGFMNFERSDDEMMIESDTGIGSGSGGDTTSKKQKRSRGREAPGNTSAQVSGGGKSKLSSIGSTGAGMSNSSGNNAASSSSSAVSSEVKAKEKNREHAKNTRMRKKTYIESLKDEVKNLSESRETLENDRRTKLGSRAVLVEAWKKAVSDFLVYRTYGELNPEVWQDLITEDFVLTLPITPYRSFPPSEVCEGSRIVKGVEGVVRDTASVAVMLKSLGRHIHDGAHVTGQFYSLNEETLSGRDRLMCSFYMCTENAVERGTKSEITKYGMLVAKFTNMTPVKICSMEMVFDVMAIMQQLRRASASTDFQVVPNILRVATEPTKEARIVTTCHAPWPIIHVSPKWCDIFGYSAEDVLGKHPQIVHGEETDREKVAEMMAEMEARLATHGYLYNYTSKGDKILVFLQMYPIYTEGQMSHHLCVLHIATQSAPAPVPLDRPRKMTGIPSSGSGTNYGGSLSGSDSGRSSPRGGHAGFRPPLQDPATASPAHFTIPEEIEATAIAAAAARDGQSSVGHTSSSASSSSGVTDDTERCHSEKEAHLESSSGTSGSARNTDTANSPVDVKRDTDLSSLSLEGVFPKNTVLPIEEEVANAYGQGRSDSPTK